MTPSTKKISRLIFFITITLIIEMLGLPQPFTGPLVNMMLILTSLVISPLAAIVLGAITPLVAALRGQLPAFLIPMVPFIILANALFIVVFTLLRRFFKKWLRDVNLLFSVPAWLGLLSGAFIKFFVLYNAARFLLPLLLGKHLPDKIVAMMSLPQFVTALIGGVFAFIIFNMLQSRFHLE